MIRVFYMDNDAVGWNLQPHTVVLTIAKGLKYETTISHDKLWIQNVI